MGAWSLQRKCTCDRFCSLLFCSVFYIFIFFVKPKGKYIIHLSRIYYVTLSSYQDENLMHYSQCYENSPCILYYKNIAQVERNLRTLYTMYCCNKHQTKLESRNFFLWLLLCISFIYFWCKGIMEKLVHLPPPLHPPSPLTFLHAQRLLKIHVMFL